MDLIEGHGTASTSPAAACLYECCACNAVILDPEFGQSVDDSVHAAEATEVADATEVEAYMQVLYPHALGHLLLGVSTRIRPSADSAEL